MLEQKKNNNTAIKITYFDLEYLFYFDRVRGLQLIWLCFVEKITDIKFCFYFVYLC